MNRNEETAISNRCELLEYYGLRVFRVSKAFARPVCPSFLKRGNGASRSAVRRQELTMDPESNVIDANGGSEEPGSSEVNPASVDDAKDAMHLYPPESCGERFRDSILRTLDHPFFQALGLAVLFLVIVDGAFFFFLLLGWQSLCRPRTDCEPRNWWYNCSIQILNVLFTYMATASMPWRSTNFLHICGLGCPRRQKDPGHDLYGRVAPSDVWFHIPLRKRLGITVVLLLNCLTQYANQATRIRYHSFEMQNEAPGNIWTNVFFAASFLFAGIGGAWMGYEVYALRKADPQHQFGPGPVELARTFYDSHFRTKEGQEHREDHQVIADNTVNTDPTRETRRRSLVNIDRSSMRMWAM
jgi:hypothetical protein